MARFNIDVFASQCGVTPANIRSWQRYGLIKPHADERGHRFFDIDHCARVNEIVSWLEKGVPVCNILALLNGEALRRDSGWFAIQDVLISHCREQQYAKLRGLIWRYGRELPPAIFIDEMIRPLRLWMSADSRSGMTMARAALDGALIEYATFVLASGRKRYGSSMCIIAMSLNDSVDIWLESIRYASDGFRVEVLPHVITMPELDKIKADHIVVWVDRVLNQKQRVEYQRWVAEGKPVILAGSAAGETLNTLANYTERRLFGQ
ncbi:MerR family transcriptional regulator [Klebsiella sp. BIGb0407]|uniref:MerR family transcriptional regulator n=1 Tax=Klebsiella sp. BIGb0407 TaxID=2940603 RepID=UPI0021694030|nr:MerR family transcriptional regulator [Klebsiella sp. BIGb0407]MCS3430136.1 DNA-binding transcriptional MerR regulator [Klebsiella sp. BIGb0407]